ncbi:hypothetical protein GCM10011419_28350 [Vogesella fluminis]|uniref:Ricin B lectin domain-containing protein n=1 Tax=Vogesella fluminis TaxID=1069161 RepID=A0ABQ3HFH4_9NEIS|nr:hypothetical protein GCM10011419_28350 [Vogesella fluminis]
MWDGAANLELMRDTECVSRQSRIDVAACQGAGSRVISCSMSSPPTFTRLAQCSDAWAEGGTLLLWSPP